MTKTEKEVTLTVSIGGVQVSRGRYAYALKSSKDGVVEYAATEKEPVLSNASESVKLGEQFVVGALMQPPKEMKMNLNTWLSIPQNKRIGIHVKQYVLDLYPDHCGYSYEILH